MKVEEIAAVLEFKKQFHPELQRGLTWPGFTRICKKEGIAIAFQSLPREAQLVPFLGNWTILLNKDLPFRRHTYRGAHELGHLWLHHDRKHDRTERVYNMDTTWEADPREDDAEIFCQLILMGPKRSAPFIPPAPAKPQPERRDPRLETALQFSMRMARMQAKAERR
jgi:hypothetical protein